MINDTRTCLIFLVEDIQPAKLTACDNGHMYLRHFFRGSVSWFSLADNWGFVSRGSIRVTLKEKIVFFEGKCEWVAFAKHSGKLTWFYY